MGKNGTDAQTVLYGAGSYGEESDVMTIGAEHASFAGRAPGVNRKLKSGIPPSSVVS